jgi:hypothetical protein
MEWITKRKEQNQNGRKQKVEILLRKKTLDLCCDISRLKTLIYKMEQGK